MSLLSFLRNARNWAPGRRNLTTTASTRSAKTKSSFTDRCEDSTVPEDTFLLLSDSSGITQEELPRTPNSCQTSSLMFATTKQGLRRSHVQCAGTRTRKANCCSCNKICLIVGALVFLDSFLLVVIFSSKYSNLVSPIFDYGFGVVSQAPVLSGLLSKEKSHPNADRNQGSTRGGVFIDGWPNDKISISLLRTLVVYQTAHGHATQHLLRRLRQPSKVVEVNPEAQLVDVSSAWVGARVRRGRDWKQVYGDQDGGEGGLGTITKVHALGKRLCAVRWDCGEEGIYRTGFGGKFEIEYAPARGKPSNGEAVKKVPILDISAVDAADEAVRGFSGNLGATAKDRLRSLEPSQQRAVFNRYFGRHGLNYMADPALAKMSLHGLDKSSIDKNDAAVSDLVPGPSGWDRAEDLACDLLNVLGLAEEAWTDSCILRDPDDCDGDDRNANRWGAAVAVEHSRLSLRPEYYYIAHFSQFVTPGSRRLQVTLKTSPIFRRFGPGHDARICENLDSAAFLRPDGVLVVVALNRGDESAAFEVSDGLRTMRATVPAHAIQTYLLRVSTKTEKPATSGKEFV